MNERQSLVSVVTPVYNEAQHIEECIQSVIAQTYENWEYIICDNCSDDGTVEIADRYAQKDPRVCLIRPDGFVSADANANRALRRISPESRYTKIVYADDWLYPECLERMLTVAESNPSVGIVSAYRLEGDRVSLDGLPYTVSILAGRDVGRSHLLDGPYPYLFGSTSSVLVRSDLVRRRHNYLNPNNPYQSDQEACYDALQDTDFGFVHQVLTFSRRRDEGESSFFVRVGANRPEHLKLFLKYGPAYLTPAEYQRKLAVLLVEYAGFLATRILRVGDGGFRRYHREAIAGILPKIAPLDVGRGVLRQLPRSTSRRLAALRLR